MQLEERLIHELGFDPDILGQPRMQRALDRLKDQSKPSAFAELTEQLVVPETWFFRCKASFEALKNKAQEGHWTPQQPLRLLSAPCSTGEEPYSMAILLSGLLPEDCYKIHAMDISAHSLKRAKKGLYRSYSFREAGTFDWLADYIKAANNEHQLDEQIIRQVQFSQANLLDTAFWKQASCYDMIFCRNALIYMREQARNTILTFIKRHLNPDGILVTGPSEFLLCLNSGMGPILPKGAFACSRQKKARKKQISKPAQPCVSVIGSPKVKQREMPKPTAEEQLAEAHVLADAARFTEARNLCSSYLTQRPQDANAQALLGMIYQAENNLEAAETALRKALYLDPKNEGAILSMSLILEGRNETQRAQALRYRLIKERS